jgi:hypothetical protein
MVRRSGEIEDYFRYCVVAVSVIGADCAVVPWVLVCDDEPLHPVKRVVATMKAEASTRRNWVIVGLPRVEKKTRDGRDLS